MTKTTNTTSRQSTRAKKSASDSDSQKAKQPTRLEQMENLLCRPGGASIAELTEATGWQPHSVRGAMAGALKKRGLLITSQKHDGVRRYYAEKAE